MNIHLPNSKNGPSGPEALWTIKLVDNYEFKWMKNLGFTIDSNLTMTSQVTSVCRSAYYHLSQIAKIRDSVSTTVCKSLIHGLVTSRIDYGNAILFGISDRHLHRLEMVQRVCSSNCYANPAGWPAVHDDNTAAILAACQKAYRIQATSTRAQGFIRRHARVSRGTATPARASPIAALCKSSKCQKWI